MNVAGDPWLAVFESALDAMVVADDDGRWVAVNDAAVELFGAPRPELIGRRPHDFAAPGYDVDVAWKDFLASELGRGEFVLRRPDGSVRHAEFRARANIVPGRHLSVLRDVTPRKEAESAREDAVATLEAAQAIAHVGSWTWTPPGPGGRVSATSETLRIFGFEVGSAVSMERFLAHIHPEDVGRIQRALEEAIGLDAPTDSEMRIVRPDGTMRWVYARAFVERDAAGQPRRMLGTTLDITERKRAEDELHAREEQLRKLQRLEALGQLAGGVAHDFNNILSVILGYTTALLDEQTGDEALREDLGEIRAAGERGSSLVRQLLAFSRTQVLRPCVFDLAETLAAMTTMLRRLVGEDVEVVLAPSPEPTHVRADPGQIERIVMNLVLNARDAMPGGGRVTVSTAVEELDERAASAKRIPAGSYVVLAIADTGTGMDEETRQRAFEPFFTTKEKGTGLGLASVYGIVQQSGGHVTFATEPGAGTTFTILLPSADAAARPAETLDAERTGGERTRGRGETVLLVEDDDHVRALARSVLRRAGYVVLEAANAGEALLVAERFACSAKRSSSPSRRRRSISSSRSSRCPASAASSSRSASSRCAPASRCSTRAGTSMRARPRRRSSSETPGSSRSRSPPPAWCRASRTPSRGPTAASARPLVSGTQPC